MEKKQQNRIDDPVWSTEGVGELRHLEDHGDLHVLLPPQGRPESVVIGYRLFIGFLPGFRRKERDGRGRWVLWCFFLFGICAE